LGLRRRHVHRSALYVGGVFHRVGEALLKDKSRAEAVGAEKGTFDDWTNALLAEADDVSLLPGGQSAVDMIAKADRDLHLGLAMALAYFEAHPPDPKRWRIVEVEKKLCIRFSGLSHPLAGQLDLLLHEIRIGNGWLEDHKTTGDAPAEAADALPCDIQPQVYRLLAMTAYPSVPLVGIVHNLVWKPRIRYSPRTLDKAGFFDGYLPRILAEYEKHPQPFVRSVVRFTTPLPPADLWRQIQIGCRACKAPLDLARFPRCGNQYTCSNLIGRQPCEFLQFCRAQDVRPGQWSRWIGTSPKPFYQEHRDYPLPLLQPLETLDDAPDRTPTNYTIA
jgi:hypothetical protein